MQAGDVVWLHDGSAALLLEEGEGVPGRYEGEGPQARWVENADYRPSVIARLTTEQVEPAQYAASPDETATAARAAAIEEGTHSDFPGNQFVHVPAEAPAVPSGATVVSGDPLAGKVTDADARTEAAKVGGVDTAQQQLTDDERAELAQLRADAASRAGDTTPPQHNAPAQTVAEQQT